MAKLLRCINCDCDFTSLKRKIDTICLTDEKSQVQEFAIIDILSEIYKLDLIDCINESRDNKSLFCDTNENSDKSTKALCASCFNHFKVLYEYYHDFNQIRNSTSYLSKEINKLNNLISELKTTGKITRAGNNQSSSKLDESGVADCDMVILSDDDEEFEDETGDPLKVQTGNYEEDEEGMEVGFPIFDNEEIRVLNEVVVCDDDTQISSKTVQPQLKSSTIVKDSTPSTSKAPPNKGTTPISKLSTKKPAHVQKTLTKVTQKRDKSTLSSKFKSGTQLTEKVVVEFQCDICWKTFDKLEIFRQHVESTHPTQQSSLDKSSSSLSSQHGPQDISQVKVKAVSHEQVLNPIPGSSRCRVMTYSARGSSQIEPNSRESEPRVETTASSSQSKYIFHNLGSKTPIRVIINTGNVAENVPPPQIPNLNTTAATNTTTTSSSSSPSRTTDQTTKVVLVTRPRRIRKKRKKPSKAHFTQKSPYWTQELLYPRKKKNVTVTPLAHVPFPDHGPPYNCPHCQDSGVSSSNLTIFNLSTDYEKHVKEEHFGLKKINVDDIDSAEDDQVESEDNSETGEIEGDGQIETATNVVTTMFSKTGLCYTFKNCPPFQCPYCDLKGGTLDVIRNHIKGHHFNLDLTCTTCSEIFLTRDDLLNHLATCNPYHEGTRSTSRNQSADESQLFICEFCGKECLKAVYLKKHKQRVHGDNNAFPCLVCSKSFRTRTYLSRHMDCHVESRDFICHHCGGGFKSAHHLRMHVRRVHS